MKKEEVLAYLQLSELPEKATKSADKCAVLVERENHVKDYAIASNGGIVVDKGSRSHVVRVLEYYPVIIGEDKPEEEEEIEVPAKPVKINRKQTIEYLVSKKMRRDVMETKSDEELVRLMKVYKR